MRYCVILDAALCPRTTKQQFILWFLIRFYTCPYTFVCCTHPAGPICPICPVKSEPLHRYWSGIPWQRAGCPQRCTAQDGYPRNLLDLKTSKHILKRVALPLSHSSTLSFSCLFIITDHPLMHHSSHPPHISPFETTSLAPSLTLKGGG